MLILGIDLIEIKRIKKSMKNPKFIKKILGNEEFSQLQERKFPPQSVAASFAAKEAFSKALGTGISGFSYKDIQLLRNQNGAPYLYLSKNMFNIPIVKKCKFAVSVTHTRELACVAVVGSSLD